MPASFLDNVFVLWLCTKRLRICLSEISAIKVLEYNRIECTECAIKGYFLGKSELGLTQKALLTSPPPHTLWPLLLH